MSSPSSIDQVVISGWLRKRPRFGTGSWSKRFFVLSKSDATIRAFSDESESALVSSKMARSRSLRYKLNNDDSDKNLDDPEPSHSIVLPKDVVCTDPFEKSVRVSRSGSKREKVWVIKVYRTVKDDKFESLISLGATTREEAAKWKISIEQTAKIAQIPPPPSASARDLLEASSVNSEGTKSMKRGGSFWGGSDDRWQVVESQDGVQIEGEKEFTKEFPSLRARATVNAAPKEVFDLIMDDSKRTIWDDGVEKNEVLRQISETSHIVYVQMRPIWIGPLFTGARDLVLLRYWRKDPDGTYVLTWQSVEDPDLSPAREGYTRGKIFAMGFSIIPVDKHPDQSLVRLFCHADPGPPLNVMPSLVLQKWLYPFVTRITGIKKALEKSKNLVHAPGLQGNDIVDRDEPSVVVVAPPSPPTKSSTTPAGAEEEEINNVKLGSFEHSEWMETPKNEPYTIRGKNYLEDGVKYKSHRHMFHMIAADLYKLTEPTPHCAARSDSPIAKIREAYPERPIFVLQFMLPGPPFYSLAIYAVAKRGVIDDPDAPFTRLWTDFIEGTDDYRSSVFKMIPRVTQGAYVVRKTVGETPALLAKKMKMNFYVAKDYIECDCDLGTSAVAGSILSIVKGYATTLTVDLGILLEGHSTDKLPEQMLCAFRMVKPYMSKARLLGPDPNPAQTQKNMDAVKSKTDRVDSDNDE
jgi:hypothetical protein